MDIMKNINFVKKIDQTQMKTKTNIRITLFAFIISFLIPQNLQTLEAADLLTRGQVTFTKSNPIAVIKTEEGYITLRLFPEQTPKTVENFIGLVKQKKYTGNVFHRVIKNFMIQGGDYENQNGTGGKSIWGRPFEDEFSEELKHKRGVISMANAGANTNGSQFFITQRASHHLDGKHTVFGEVIEGMEVVDKIAGIKTDTMGRPVFPIKMDISMVEEIVEEEIPREFTDQNQIPQWALEATKDFVERGIISGNEDGSFAPFRPVNRAELAKIMVLAKEIELSQGDDSHFHDVSSNAWYHPYVEAIYEQGWIDGYPDGTFHPERTINRAEISKIVSNAFGLQEPDSGELSFFDVRETDWFYPYVKKVYKNQVMNHNGLGYFYPGKALQRARTVKIVYDAGQKNVK